MFKTSLSRHRALGAAFAAILALTSASAWALGSTPVTVINEPGRTPYVFSAAPISCAQLVCEVTSPPVPAGKRLVIQHVSVNAGITTSETAAVVLVSSVAPPVLLSSFAAGVASSSFFAPGRGFAADQAVQGYVDEGHSVDVTIFTTFMVDPTFVITGYLIDCTVNACAPTLP